MDLPTAMELADSGKKLTNPTLQADAVMMVKNDNYYIVFENTGDSCVFTPRAEHHNEQWQVKAGWASYA
jgi:hypothetical protein